MPRTKAAIRPIYTGKDWMCPTRLLWDGGGREIQVTSATAAVRACREAGYRVMKAGGLVCLTSEEKKSSDGSLVTYPVWAVTVHPVQP